MKRIHYQGAKFGLWTSWVRCFWTIHHLVFLGKFWGFRLYIERVGHATKTLRDGELTPFRTIWYPFEGAAMYI